jgi:hypothetical protein
MDDGTEDVSQATSQRCFGVLDGVIAENVSCVNNFGRAAVMLAYFNSQTVYTFCSEYNLVIT